VITVVTATKISNAAPALWECRTEDGRLLFARYRWFLLQISLHGLNGQCAEDATDEECVFSVDHAGKSDHTLSYEELKTLTRGIIGWPAAELVRTGGVADAISGV
jgi:hypothetical protein